jgi:hypothetical protein
MAYLSLRDLSAMTEVSNPYLSLGAGAAEPSAWVASRSHRHSTSAEAGAARGVPQLHWSGLSGLAGDVADTLLPQRAVNRRSNPTHAGPIRYHIDLWANAFATRILFSRSASRQSASVGQT